MTIAQREQANGKDNTFGAAANDVAQRSLHAILIHQSTQQTAEGDVFTDTLNTQQMDRMRPSDRLGIIRLLLADVADVQMSKAVMDTLVITTNGTSQRDKAAQLIAEFLPLFFDLKQTVQKKKPLTEPLRDAVKHLRLTFGLNNPPPRNAHIPLEGLPEAKLTARQIAYKQAIRRSNCVFGYGPAGTGKTSLAIEAGVELYNAGLISSILVAKPVAISKGEEAVIGAFGGNQDGKFDPYFENIISLFNKRIGADRFADLRAKGVIKFKPFSMMRGQNFDGAFVILDEAQNCTPAQIRTILTRLADSPDGAIKPRIVITGDLDPEQKDTPASVKCGLLHALVHYTPERITGSLQIAFGPEDIKRSKIAAEVHEAAKAPDESHPLFARYCQEFGIETGAALPAGIRRNRNEKVAANP